MQMEHALLAHMSTLARYRSTIPLLYKVLDAEPCSAVLLVYSILCCFTTVQQTTSSTRVYMSMPTYAATRYNMCSDSPQPPGKTATRAVHIHPVTTKHAGQ